MSFLEKFKLQKNIRDLHPKKEEEGEEEYAWRNKAREPSNLAWLLKLKAINIWMFYIFIWMYISNFLPKKSQLLGVTYSLGINTKQET